MHGLISYRPTQLLSRLTSGAFLSFRVASICVHRAQMRVVQSDEADLAMSEFGWV